MERVAIIGGGPAGLAAGYALAQQGISFMLFEAGAALADRHHDIADQLGAGIGGAGLFSDGKFSFYPSGTHLYRLRDRSRLQSAYAAIGAQLTKAGIEAPPLSDWGDGAFSGGADRAMVAKPYLSTYGSLTQRNALIADMTGPFRDRIHVHTSVEAIAPGPKGYRLRVRNRDGHVAEHAFGQVIIATGRFGPQALPGMLAGADMVEMRYEFGIRIEHRNEVGFLNAVKRPDVKYILDALSTEVRTFCTCRDGEVWMIPYGQVAALSGRSDGPKSGYSNFGLLARFTGENCERGRSLWLELQARLSDNAPAVWQTLTDFLDRPTARQKKGSIDPDSRPWFPRGHFQQGDVAGLIPPELWEILAKSARMLIKHFPDLASPETVCIFPAIEGVGVFPGTNADMQAKEGGVQYCGDVVGRFRGLVPAMVSGHYAGTAIAARIRDQARSPVRDSLPQTVL